MPRRRGEWREGVDNYKNSPIFPPLFYKTKASVLKQVFVSVFWLVIQEKMRF